MRFKLHFGVSNTGELLAVQLTPGDADDRRPVEALTHDLFGKRFGDKAYLSQDLFETLPGRGLELVTTLKKTMTGQRLRFADRLLLRKRFLSECAKLEVCRPVTDQLKNVSQIAHTRHRSPANFAVNLLAGLVAYTLQPKKPCIRLPDDLPRLPALS